MKACAEKHVVEALAIQERALNPKTPDVVESALEYLNELDRCPGPKCNMPFEHNGIYTYVYGKCTLSNSMQVDAWPCFAKMVANAIIVFGARASSSLMARSSRMMGGRRMATF